MSIEITVKGLLDRLNPAVRHYLLLFVGSILTWAATEAADLQITGTPAVDAVVVAGVGSLLATITLYFTRLTRQYGVGSDE